VTASFCRGAGLGLRPPHLHTVAREQPAVPWFEVHICNYLGGGLNRALLREISEQYPLSFHGVNLNLGGVDPLDENYLELLRRAVEELQPALVSEHACFTSLRGHHYHDLLPVPYTWESAMHMAARIKQVQDVLGRQILLENISRYRSYGESSLSEGEFLSIVCEEADCGLLLDLNNAWVNQCNLGEDLWQFVETLPLDRVGEIHLAGYSVQDGLLIDTHSAPPDDVLWEHFTRFTELRSDIPCLIEWDSKLPPLEDLMLLQARAQAIIDRVTSIPGQARLQA
jgi:uncharacterized protein (UPF0276 family)